MTPFLWKLVISAVSAILTFVLLMFVLQDMLGVWWVDAAAGLVIAVLVWKYVSLAQLHKAADATKATIGVK